MTDHLIKAYFDHYVRLLDADCWWPFQNCWDTHTDYLLYYLPILIIHKTYYKQNIQIYVQFYYMANIFNHKHISLLPLYGF